MRLRQRRVLLMLGAAVCGASMLQAQSPAPDADPATAPTVRVQSRLVVEDVLVMDAHGNPVHGLPQSAFHVFDNEKPQQLRDFQEGSPVTAKQPLASPLPLGTFSNEALTGVAPTTEIVLIDTDDTALLDQMFLLKQLQQSFARMPADLPVVIFSVRNGRVIPVLSATTDRVAMSRALDDILPVQNHAIDSRFQSAVNQLMTVAAFLQQTSGRKNLLWFSGSYPLVSVAVGEQASFGSRVSFRERENVIHQVQEALAEARISVYPVDVRGVLPNSPLVQNPGGGALAGDRNPRAVNAASQQREVGGPDGAGPAEQHGEARTLAGATGGRAYWLNNLSEEIGQAFDLGRSAYTLSYTPSPYSIDQSFHSIRMWVDGGYTLSYRTGYLATFTGAANEPQRVRLTQDGLKAVDPALNKPLVFQVHLEPHGDAQHVMVDFSIPLIQLKQEHTNGVWSSRLVVTTYAYDPSGKMRNGKMQELDTDLNDAQYEQARLREQRIATKQELIVPKGSKYLLVVARDRGSQRTGSLLVQTRLLAALPGTASEPAASAKDRGTPATP